MIKNKNILFIAPKFYDYHTDIIKTLELKGAIVTFYPENINSVIYRLATKLYPKLAFFLYNKYVNEILDNVKKNRYDIVFVIRGEILSSSTLQAIKNILIDCKFVMYQWDSNKQSNYINKIKYFDVVKTFDKKDSVEYNLEYLPLFYTKKYKDVANNKKEKMYDIVFYGAYHCDRLDIVKFMDDYCKKKSLVFKYHLYITKMALFRFLVTGKIRLSELKYFKTFSVNSNKILDDYKKSISVLDIELNIQSGLTIRTFEALGSNLKLITTNQNIRKEFFYNSEQIIIIDRKNIEIDIEKFKSNFTLSNMDEFYIDNWIKKLLY